MTFKNNSNLSYDIEDLKFSIEDKKIHKATNNQSIEMTPLFQLNPQKHFRKISEIFMCSKNSLIRTPK
jgi:hypothetical protein